MPGAPAVGLAPPGESMLTATNPPAASGPRWLMLGGVYRVAGHRNTGLRGDLDLVRRDWWTVGISASVLDGSAGDINLETSGSGTLFVAGTLAVGRWELRAQLGSGMSVIRDATYSDTLRPNRAIHELFIRPVGEAALLVSYELGDHWAFAAGPVATTNLMTLHYRDGGDYTDRAALLVLAGFRHRM